MRTESDERWLAVALHDDERGRAAWAGIVGDLDLDAIDSGQARLLPLVRRNLVRWGIDHPEMARIAGVERAAWVRTQYLRDAAARAIAALGERGIDVAVMKGTALSNRAYAHPTLRPMRDIDLLVKPADVPEATRVLTELGYSGASPFDRQATVGRHAVTYGRGDGAAVDLHWMPHRYLAPRGITRSFRGLPWDADVEADPLWSRAEQVEVGSATAYLPTAADLLVHACVHGIASAGAGRLQWVTDAAALLGPGGGQADGAEEGEAVDWDVVVVEARDRHLSLLLGGALGFLAEGATLPVPRDVVDAVRRIPVSARDRFVYREVVTAPQRAALTGAAREALAHYVALTAREPTGATVREGPWCFAAWWGVDRPGRLVEFAGTRAARNVGRWFNGARRAD